MAKGLILYVFYFGSRRLEVKLQTLDVFIFMGEYVRMGMNIRRIQQQFVDIVKDTKLFHLIIFGNNSDKGCLHSVQVCKATPIKS